MQQTIGSLNNQLGDLNSRLETKPTRSNSLHEIEQAFGDSKDEQHKEQWDNKSKEEEQRPRQESAVSQTRSKRLSIVAKVDTADLQNKLEAAVKKSEALEQHLT